MKTITTTFLFLTVLIIFLSCSSDNEIFYTETVYPDSLEKNLPIQPIPEIGALKLPGFPKSVKRYQNGILQYWAQYYYRPEGNLHTVNYGYTESASQVFTDIYQYDTGGKLKKLEGHDVYDFYWEGNRIVEADKRNAMWNGRSKIFYEYNPKGQLIQKTENNLDFSYSEKVIYSYFEDGNLSKIENYWDTHGSGIFDPFYVTNFENYNEDKNMFLELEIIPEQIVQHQFPSSMNSKHLTEAGYDLYEAHSYNYDTKGRVIEKIFRNNKVVYQYY